jgi:diadenosine tetraphosphatase ApaH/serine/threonine PP2A family protein phosphatase
VPDVTRLALLGGVYANAPALAAALRDARGRGADGIYALGDFGGFGPHPDRVFPLLVRGGVQAIQGNYEQALAEGAGDCRCGYTDPRDAHYAQLSYDYTAEHTSEAWKRWMGALPPTLRVDAGGTRVLLCHGSPRRVNEFLWESTSSDPFLARLLREHDADVIACTHTGLHWARRLPSGGTVVNAGVLGRPANDGTPRVWYAMVEVGGPPARGVQVTFVPVAYDHEALAREMREERLPEEFVETILTGWWTTCLEILPAKERRRGRH